jgi:type I restriction-modification system DNA methylase subunit
VNRLFPSPRRTRKESGTARESAAAASEKHEFRLDSRDPQSDNSQTKHLGSRNPMPIPPAVADLVQRYRNNRAFYEGPAYNEAQLRQEFLDPLMEAFEWDMSNKAGYAPAYREVIHEDSLKIDGQSKAPDYAFRIGETRKFFLEAKKPAVRIEKDGIAAYQLRRYAWSAKLPISILTNFAELAVYDCRKKPNQSEKASTARIMFIRVNELADRWDELHGIFAKPSILKGSFDKFAESAKAKRGTATVDGAFLEEIEGWREELAKNLALRNKELTQRELNFAVQTIIDRIIFLRMCEDMGMEPYGKLKEQADEKNVYRKLTELFHLADYKYNSGLFHFNKEPDRDSPDRLTPQLLIDDKVLKPILRNLYYPESPYVFKVMPADILGQVYEQFLGKVIRLTDAHVAKVEEKPEVKKAGGVYYTPTYIVDYIVKQTVGKLVEGKAPAEVAKLRVLDPACGSGSFLLGAYDFLLKWHLRWYIDDGAEKHKKEVLILPSGLTQLTTSEKKRILLNNIYGVDIDTQAVEVTKLSLLLKVLEGETEGSLKSGPRLTAERVLPDLEKNIKCGNSLIGPDIYIDDANQGLDAEERLRINAFDWKAAFPKIMEGKDAGFDAVIGNPPYIRIQVMSEWAPKEVEFYKRFTSAQEGNYDIYVVFIEKGLQLLNQNGKLGYICPNKFFNAKYGRPIRSIIAKGRHLSHAVHFGDQQIFDGATTYTTMLFLDKRPVDVFNFVRVSKLEKWRYGSENNDGTLPSKGITENEWNFTAGAGSKLLDRLHKLQPKLSDVADLFVGLQSSADKIYVVDNSSPIEHSITKPFLQTGDLKAYSSINASARLIFPYEIAEGHATLINEQTLRANAPKCWAYLSQHREKLSQRDMGGSDGPWYRFGRTQNMSRMESQKLIIQVTANRPTVLLDEIGLYMSGGGAGPFYGLRPKSNDFPIKCLMGILNSKVFDYIVKSQSTPLRGGYVKFSKQYIETVPIPLPDKSNEKRIVQLVDAMLSLNKQLAAAKTPHEQASLRGQIDATDRQIDAIVYELYGLTEEEIAIVEAATAAKE